MNFEEAKAREDYMFDASVLYHYLDEIRRGKFDCHDEEEGEHIWGVSILEIGYVDIEVNLLSGEEDENGKVANEVYPCYFICVKDDCDDWNSWSIGYVDDKYPVNVDFCKADWEEQLERDMFEKLMCVVKDYNLHINEPNILD